MPRNTLPVTPLPQQLCDPLQAFPIHNLKRALLQAIQIQHADYLPTIARKYRCHNLAPRRAIACNMAWVRVNVVYKHTDLVHECVRTDSLASYSTNELASGPTGEGAQKERGSSAFRSRGGRRFGLGKHVRNKIKTYSTT